MTIGSQPMNENLERRRLVGPAVRMTALLFPVEKPVFSEKTGF